MPWLTPWWTRARSNCLGGIFCARRARRGRAPALCRRRWGTYMCDVTHSHEPSRNMMRFVLFLRGVLDKESLSPCVGTVAHICVTLSIHMRNDSLSYETYGIFFLVCVRHAWRERAQEMCQGCSTHMCDTTYSCVWHIYSYETWRNYSYVSIFIHMYTYLFISVTLFIQMMHYSFVWDMA